MLSMQLLICRSYQVAVDKLPKMHASLDKAIDIVTWLA